MGEKISSLGRVDRGMRTAENVMQKFYYCSGVLHVMKISSQNCINRGRGINPQH